MPRNQSESSFIPKTGSFNPPTGGGKRSGGSVLVLVSLGLLIVAVLAAGGLFVYKQNLQSNLSEQRQQLEQARSAFDPALIDELAGLETRISTAQNLLDQHVAFTPIFSIIESVTLSTVQFNSMQVSRESESDTSAENGSEESSSRGVTVNMTGVGPGYATIALQSSELADHDKITNPVLSQFELNNEGNVEFSVQFSIPQSEILYKNTI